MSYRAVDFEAYVGPHRLFVEGVRPEMETHRPAIIFVGGAFDGSWICRQQLDYWAARGWPAYALNLRGYYKSRYHNIAELSYQDYLDDILTVRDYFPLHQAIYAGYSMGGVLVQKFAELYGAHTLILFDSDPPREVAQLIGEKPDESQDVPPVMNFWPTQEIVEEMLGRPVDEDEYQELLEYFKQSFLSGRAYRELEIERIEVDPTKVDCPVLQISVSSKDKAQAGMARYYKASRLVFEGYSHGAILFSRFHKPITRRVTDWLDAGCPGGINETYRFEEIAAEEVEGEKSRILYFTEWEEPKVCLCSRRGLEILPLRMERVNNEPSGDDGLFKADLRLFAGEKFYLTCGGEEDRPDGANFYEPCCGTLYLKDGEFFDHYPPQTRRKPSYLTREIHSPELDHTFTINIMLPRDHDGKADKPYPVAVLNDGQNQWKDQGAYGGWHTDVIAVDRARRGRCRDIVLVSIEAHPERDASYLPAPYGFADRYIDFVADTILPVLREEFNISSDPGEIGMIGASYAATCSIFAGIRRPDTFGLVGSFSYPYVADDAVRTQMQFMEALPMRRFYVDCGTRWSYDQSHKDDFIDITRDLIRSAMAKGMVPGENLLGIIAEGHFHNEEFWRKRIGRCLEFLYPLKPVINNG